MEARRRFAEFDTETADDAQSLPSSLSASKDVFNNNDHRTSLIMAQMFGDTSSEMCIRDRFERVINEACDVNLFMPLLQVKDPQYMKATVAPVSYTHLHVERD